MCVCLCVCVLLCDSIFSTNSLLAIVDGEGTAGTTQDMVSIYTTEIVQERVMD